MLGALLTIIFIVVYFLSILGMIRIYVEKELDICFWGFVLALLPIVNTIIFIIFFDNWDIIKNFFSLKKFFNELKQ